MSIELPPLPPIPGTEATPAQWDVYLRIAALHTSTATASAISAQTAQMALMVAASERHAALMQQLLDQTPPATSPGTARVVVAALMSEAGGERAPAEVASAVLARVAAVDTMLGGETP